MDYLQLGIFASNPNVKKYIDSELLYLGKYILSTDQVLTANSLDKSIPELKEMLADDKIDKGVTGKAKKVELISVLDNQTLTLDSLSACVKYFKGLGYSTSSNTLVSRIKSGM